MNPRKLIAVLLLIAILLIASAFPVNAATEGSVTGRFGINAAPTISSVSFVPTAMTPQTQYTVSVTASDPDTVNDWRTAVLKIWYDADGGIPSEAEFDSVTASAQNAAVIPWTATAPGGTTYTGTTALTPAATTWVLGTCTTPLKSGGSNPGDYALTTYTFQFVFTPGKVTTMTSGSGKWQIAAKITDTGYQTGWAYDAEATTMAFYSEISVPAVTLDWGNLTPGTDFGVASQKAVGVTITCTANGPYDEKVKSSATWTGVTYSASLDATGLTNLAQQFSLKADDTATLGSAVLVDTAGVVIDDTGNQTAEAGDGVSTYNIWLKLANPMQKDVYSGAITFTIANGT